MEADCISEIKSHLKQLCACKGIRTCKICEKNKVDLLKNKELNNDILDLTDKILIKNNIFDNYNSNQENINLNIVKIQVQEFFLSENNINFSGLYLFSNLFSEEEINSMINEMNKKEWVESQSGRKKQDFGVKVNYKKKKVKSDYNTIVFPKYKQFIEERIEQLYKLSNLEILKNYKLHEIGNLYYCKERGSHIEAHIDDDWIWGNRILGVNLLSDTIITFSKEINSVDNLIVKNLDSVDNITKKENLNVNVQSKSESTLIELNIPLLKNQVYLFSGISRYEWKHQVKPENITSERIVITCREFVPEILESITLNPNKININV
jgi:alkylated DNA repair protein alkB family protein 4